MIQARGLACDSPEGQPLVEGLDLALRRGGNLLVTGTSGSGKSRLLKVLAGLERPRRGEVRVGDIAVWPGDGALALAGHVRVGFAFATGGLLSNLSLADNVALPLRFLGVPGAAAARRAAAALERLGLGSVSHLRPHAVGGSARKHANLARVLALEPELVLLDGPLEGLDAPDRGAALEVVRAWAGDPACTLVVATEDADPFVGLRADHLRMGPAPAPMEPT